jgi:hypothetical protein
VLGKDLEARLPEKEGFVHVARDEDTVHVGVEMRDWAVVR